MKILLVIILLASISLQAQSLYVASDKEIRDLLEKKSTRKPSRFKRKMNLRFQSSESCQLTSLFAESLTRTVIRKWSVQFRKAYNPKTLSITRRSCKGNLLFEYSRNIGEEYKLALLNNKGENVISWQFSETFGFWQNSVSILEIKNMLNALDSAGFKLKDISFSVKNKKKYDNAVSLLRKLGIIDKALIGIDENVEFTKIRIGIKEENK